MNVCVPGHFSPVPLHDPMDCGLPGSSIHGIIQAGILEWLAISFCKGSSWTRNQICGSCIGRWILYHWASWESPSIVNNTAINLWIYIPNQDVGSFPSCICIDMGLCNSIFLKLFIYLFIFLFVVNFVIHWNETAMGLHVFPIPIPPPPSLSTRSP